MGIIEHLYDIATSRKEWYGEIKVFATEELGMGSLLDKPVFHRAGKQFQYGFGIFLRDKWIGGSGNGISAVGGGFG